jgi:hypothetical protein
MPGSFEMDNRLREIEQWVAEARDGLGDGGREAYVHKLYLLDAEIRAVIKDSGILPQVVSPRPATSLVRHLSSLALPVASAVVVLAVATVYLRGGILKQVSSILTARPESAQKNTPPAGPSSPADWQQYLASNGETIVEFATAPADVEHEPIMLASNKSPTAIHLERPTVADASLRPNGGKDAAATGKTVGNASSATAPTQPIKENIQPPIILASVKRPVQAGANESTSVAASPVMLAGYSPVPAEEAPAETQPAPRKVKNRKAGKPVEDGDEPILDLAPLIAKGNDALDKH